MNDRFISSSYSISCPLPSHEAIKTCVTAFHNFGTLVIKRMHSNLSYLDNIAPVCLISSKLRVGIKTSIFSCGQEYLRPAPSRSLLDGVHILSCRLGDGVKSTWLHHSRSVQLTEIRMLLLPSLGWQEYPLPFHINHTI